VAARGDLRSRSTAQVRAGLCKLTVAQLRMTLAFAIRANRLHSTSHRPDVREQCSLSRRDRHFPGFHRRLRRAHPAYYRALLAPALSSLVLQGSAIFWLQEGASARQIFPCRPSRNMMWLRGQRTGAGGRRRLFGNATKRLAQLNWRGTSGIGPQGAASVRQSRVPRRFAGGCWPWPPSRVQQLLRDDVIGPISLLLVQRGFNQSACWACSTLSSAFATRRARAENGTASSTALPLPGWRSGQPPWRFLGSALTAIVEPTNSWWPAASYRHHRRRNFNRARAVWPMVPRNGIASRRPCIKSCPRRFPTR